MEYDAITSINVTDIDDFLFHLLIKQDVFAEDIERYIFRGEGSDTYKLLPNALRKENQQKLWSYLGGMSSRCEAESNQILAEDHILAEFYKLCNEKSFYVPYVRDYDPIYNADINRYKKGGQWISPDLYELAGLAQHYGLPTRLLDWTKDICVALYFAISDTISSKGSKGSNIVLWALNAFNINFFKEETKMPLEFIQPLYGNNGYLASQKGIFTLWKIDIPQYPYLEAQKVSRMPLDVCINNHAKNLEHLGLKNALYRISIPKDFIPKIYKFLYLIRYDTSHMYSDYHGVVSLMKEGNYRMRVKMHNSK